MTSLPQSAGCALSADTLLSVIQGWVEFFSLLPDWRFSVIGADDRHFSPSDLHSIWQTGLGFAASPALPSDFRPTWSYFGTPAPDTSSHRIRWCRYLGDWQQWPEMIETQDGQGQCCAIWMLGISDRFNGILQAIPTQNGQYQVICHYDESAISASMSAVLQTLPHPLPESPVDESAFWQERLENWSWQPNCPELHGQFTLAFFSRLERLSHPARTALEPSSDRSAHSPPSTHSTPSPDLQHLLHELFRLGRSGLGTQLLLQQAALLIQQGLGASRCLIAFYNPVAQTRVSGAIVHSPQISPTEQQTTYPDWQTLGEFLPSYPAVSPWLKDAPLPFCSPVAHSSCCTWLPRKSPAFMELVDHPAPLWGFLVVEQWENSALEIPLDPHFLHLCLHQIDLAMTQVTLSQQAEERISHTSLLNRLVAQIRASLELPHIFETVTLELGHLLVADRCLIIQYLEPQSSWKALTEYRAHPDIPSAMPAMGMGDEQNPFASAMRNLQVIQINDTRAVGYGTRSWLTNPQDLGFLEQYPGAWLILPIHRANQIWGCLAFSQDQYPRYWHESEVRFLKMVADQLAIAIYQATLYQQIQQHNQTLGAMVRDRTAELESFFDAHPDYIFVLERIPPNHPTTSQLNLRLRFCNHAFAQGLGLENRYLLQGRSLLECLPPLLAHTFLKQNLPVFETGEMIHEQETMMFTDGLRHLDTFRIPLKRPNGEVYACLGTCRDITELINTKQALSERTEQLQDALTVAKAASRAKSEFLARMSHELRTPLTAVIGMSAALLQPHLGNLNPKQSDYIQIIHDSGQHLLQLINDILDLSKIEAGKASLHLSCFSLRQVAQQSLAVLQEKAIAQQIRLTSYLENLPAEDSFWGDERRIRQILLNLLSNAVKFTPPGGEVKLRVALMEQRATLEVSDTGIGIPADKQHLLFEAFQQIDSSLNRLHEGTGLGLALTRQLVEMHGGTIEFRSTVGRGTIFTVSLPSQAKVEGKPE